MRYENDTNLKQKKKGGEGEGGGLLLMIHLCAAEPLEGEREGEIMRAGKEKKTKRRKKRKSEELKRNHLRCFCDDVRMMKEQPAEQRQNGCESL